VMFHVEYHFLVSIREVAFHVERTFWFHVEQKERFTWNIGRSDETPFHVERAFWFHVEQKERFT
jgi:hypothetical protein